MPLARFEELLLLYIQYNEWWKGPKNDTRNVEHLGSIQIGVQCLNVPYIYDSDMLQWSACTY